MALAAGGGAGYAVEADGTLWAWGCLFGGILGNGSDKGSNGPVRITGLTGVRAVAATDYDGYALEKDGTVWAWGGNPTGQLGIGPTGQWGPAS